MRFINRLCFKMRLKKCKIRIHSPKVFTNHIICEVEAPVELHDSEFSRFHQDQHIARIGAHTYVRSGCDFQSFTSIGRYCSIARGVICGAPNHNLEALSTHPAFKGEFIQKQPPIIGNDVWIGNNVMIMRGVTIGHGAVIAAGAIVTHDVQPYEIVGGVPARHIRYRFSPQVIEKLLASRWWDYPLEVLQPLRHLPVEELLQELQKLPAPTYKPPLYRIDSRNWSIKKIDNSVAG